MSEQMLDELTSEEKEELNYQFKDMEVSMG